jgi:hypothetical protein
MPQNNAYTHIKEASRDVLTFHEPEKEWPIDFASGIRTVPSWRLLQASCKKKLREMARKMDSPREFFFAMLPALITALFLESY